MTTPPRLSSRKEWDEHVIANAEYFTACKFLGRARYKTVKALTLALARARARELADTYGGSVMIYAVTSNGHSAHVENFS